MGGQVVKKDPQNPVNPIKKQRRLFMAPFRGLPHTPDSTDGR